MGERWWVQGHHLLVVSPSGISVKIVVTPISIPSEIAQEGLASAKNSSPKKAKAKVLDEQLAPATRLRKASTSIPWMRH